MGRTHEEVLREALEDPEVRAEYEKLGPEYEALRNQLKEGYIARREEDNETNSLWEYATLEGWPDDEEEYPRV